MQLPRLRGHPHTLGRGEDDSITHAEEEERYQKSPIHDLPLSHRCTSVCQLLRPSIPTCYSVDNEPFPLRMQSQTTIKIHLVKLAAYLQGMPRCAFYEPCGLEALKVQFLLAHTIA